MENNNNNFQTNYASYTPTLQDINIQKDQLDKTFDLSNSILSSTLNDNDTIMQDIWKQVDKENGTTVVPDQISFNNDNYKEYSDDDDFTYTPNNSKYYQEFKQAYSQAEKNIPDLKNYRAFFTKLAEQESGFRKSIVNKQGYSGLFQFSSNNIITFANVDKKTFLSDPVLQIESAYRLAKAFEKGFTQNDLQKASSRGITRLGLLGGAWMGGNLGVRKYLNGSGDNRDANGVSVSSRIKAFNFK